MSGTSREVISRRIHVLLRAAYDTPAAARADIEKVAHTTSDGPARACAIWPAANRIRFTSLVRSRIQTEPCAVGDDMPVGLLVADGPL